MAATNERTTNASSGTTSREFEEECDYEEILDTIGFGRTQWIVSFACGLLLMFVINETMGMGIIAIASQCEFRTTSVGKGMLNAVPFVGILCSSYFCGYLSDTIGRRTVLLYTTFIANAISCASALVPNYWMLMVFKFLNGTFVAGASAATFAYLGEFLTRQHRPVIINIASIFVGLGMTYIPAVAWYVLSLEWSFAVFDFFSFRPWRLLMFFNTLPGFVAAGILLALPESPKVLLSLGKHQDALEAVKWIHVFNTGGKKDFQVTKLKVEREPNEQQPLKGKSCISIFQKVCKDGLPLFQRPHVLNLVLSCVVMCGLFVSSTGISLWYPEIQNRFGSSESNEDEPVCKVIYASVQLKRTNATSMMNCDDTITTKSYVDAVTLGVVFTSGYIVLGAVLNFVARKVVIVTSLVVSGICCGVLLFLFNPIVISAVFCALIVLPGLCVSVLSGVVVDLVPTHVRGKAVCICLMIGRSGGIIGSNVIGILIESQCILTFGIFLGLSLLCAFLALFIPM